ncbi:MAG: DUF3343 domain-containing protein [Clostridiales bacterium]|nr:DUF3343 domain-containing protein [Clostridiales bacterium]
MNIYIKVGSITNAQRGQKLLRMHGYKSQIKKSENQSAVDGCGYALLFESDSDEPIKLLEKNKIDVRGVERK